MFSFKYVLILMFSSPFKDPKVWETAIPFWKKKQNQTLPNFDFHKLYAIASTLTVKKRNAEKNSYFGHVCFYMTMIFSPKSSLSVAFRQQIVVPA